MLRGTLRVLNAEWNSSFLERLGDISGKGEKGKENVDKATDFLGQALDASGYGDTGKEQKVSTNPSPKIQPKIDPTEELIKEINKIKERLSILPIKSSGALFGPGEGVMKIYKQMQDAEAAKKEELEKQRAEKRRVTILEGGFTWGGKKVKRM